jgi:hypothetical protein
LGHALESLNEAEPKRYGKIPPIELLVCNQRTGRPGNLGLNFLGYKKSETDKMSEALLDTIVSRSHVFPTPEAAIEAAVMAGQRKIDSGFEYKSVVEHRQ